MTAYDVTASTTAQTTIVDGDSVVVEAGVTINNPNPNTDMFDRYCVYDAAGGNNNVEIFGKVNAFVAVYLIGGHNTVDVAKNGVASGPNAGLEMYLGNNTVTNEGTVKGPGWGVYFGPSPTFDPFIDGAGNNSFTNSGLVSTSRQPGVRMDEGGNTLTNSGTIVSVKVEAVRIQSQTTDAQNTIVNTGTITGGATGVAIVTGDAAVTITNSGIITGKIMMGAGNDTYLGTDHTGETIYGGAGNDTITGGYKADTIVGGLGQDTMMGGGGADNFVFNAVAESTGKTAVADVIIHFDFAKDILTFNDAVIHSFDHVTAGNQLQAGHAALLAAPHGASLYLFVDENGVAGYQAGQDYEVVLKAPLHAPG